MVNDFNGFDKGVIGKKLPSDSALNNMKKSDLIKLLHTAEHNHNVLAQFYKNACDNSKCNRCPLGMNYNKAIDDVFDFLKTKRDKKYMKISFDDLEIKEYKEQMKAGGVNI